MKPLRVHLSVVVFSWRQVRNVSARYGRGARQLHGALDASLAALQTELAHLDLRPRAPEPGGHLAAWLRLQAAADRAVAELAAHFE
jgi:hypothetical protein